MNIPLEMVPFQGTREFDGFFCLGGMSRSFESSKTTEKKTAELKSIQDGLKNQLSNELNGDYSKPSYGSLLNNQYNGM